MITIAKYWRPWPDPRLIVLVLNNRDLNQVTWEQRVDVGRSEVRRHRRTCPTFPYARYAELIGLTGHPRGPSRAGRRRLGRALAADRPVVYRCRHRSRGPAASAAHHASNRRNVLSALLQAIRTRGRSSRQSIKQKAAGSLPGRSSDATDGGAPGDRRRSGRRARCGRLHGADRRARGRRHAGVGCDDAWSLSHAHGGGETGLGYTYADVSTAKLIESKLSGDRARRATRSIAPGGLGGDGQADPQPRPAGIASMAISAVDIALWDLKARLLGLPLVHAARRGARGGAGLRQRRLHVVLRRDSSPSSSAAGSSRASRG